MPEWWDEMINECFSCPRHAKWVVTRSDLPKKVRCCPFHLNAAIQATLGEAEGAALVSRAS